jgi:tRNA nucleotidyltransferase/poly(A) polymerase
VAAILVTLTDAGHQAALVGGCIRDLVSGTVPDDWDVATSAPPEQVVALFPGATWENRFGTVTVHTPDRPVEVTTFRSESAYRDARHPDDVRWGQSLTEDLDRRDFTINAMAWVAPGILVDPHGGQADLQARVLRAVGDPDQRLGEDALRLLRAARFAATLDLTIDPATTAAIRRHAPSAERLSGERVRDELLRMLRSPLPSRSVGLLEDLQLLSVVLPELAALRGVEQGKVLGGDALDHSLRTADALPASDPVLRLAGLLHDVGKAPTALDGHFIGHESVGATLAEARLRALAFPSADIERVTHLIRHHMVLYSSDWTDAAVRRFLRRVGADQVDDVLVLRRADTAASAGPETRDAAADELSERLAFVRRDAVLGVRDLALDGNDLIAECGMTPGPRIGLALAHLLEVVTEDPSLNTRDRLLVEARRWLSDDSKHRVEPGPTSGNR